MGLLARTWLAASIALGLALAPAFVEAAPKKAKITARTIAKWQKKKMKPDLIVEKAMAGGYKITKAEKKKLLKLKVKKPLIAKLELAQKEQAAPVTASVDAPAAAPKKEPFDPNKTIDPNSIDFDSVPPPKGMPPGIKQTETKPKNEPAPAKEQSKGKREVFAAGK
jgi:hypothetical protein